ncbi:MAG: MarR family transcriptional regulator [Lentisphaeria bacterium]|nr:MarR family transcriptional regulator [Lentisphaeria bacterium]
MSKNQMAIETTFWRDLIQVSDLMREYTTPAALERWNDITIRQINIMKTVWTLQKENPHGVTLKRLAQDLNLSSATMSETVDFLVRKEILQRQQNPNDRREVLITLTKSSEEIFNSAIRQMDALSARLLGELNEAEKVFLVSTISKISDKLKMTGKESLQ